MIRTFFKAIIAAFVVAIILAEIKWLVGFVGPEFEPLADRVKSFADEHNLNLGSKKAG